MKRSPFQATLSGTQINSMGNSINERQIENHNRLKGTSTKVSYISSIVPSMMTLMSKIKCKRWRNGIIIAFTISVLVFLMYLLR